MNLPVCKDVCNIYLHLWFVYMHSLMIQSFFTARTCSVFCYMLYVVLQVVLLLEPDDRCMIKVDNENF